MTLKGWERTSLGKFVGFEYGKSPAGVRSRGGEVPIYGTGGLMGHATTAIHPGPSVVVGRKGSLGNPIYSEGPFWAVDTTYFVSSFTGDMRWLFHLLYSLRLENYNEATGVPSLPRPTLNAVGVLRPPANEQEAIADVLATVDRAIEQTEALLAKQQRIKAGLVQDLLTRGLDARGRLRDTPADGLPNGWTVQPLGKIAIFNSGYAFKSSELTEFGPKVVRISNLHKPDFPFWRYSGPVRPEWIVRDGDLLFSWAGVASSIDCYLYRGEEALLNQHIYNLVNPDGELKCFIFHYLTWILPKLRREIEGGAGQLHLTKAKIQAIPISVPPSDEIRRINQVVRFSLNQSEAEEQWLVKLRRLKAGLIQDLLTGRMPVTPLLAEPLSALDHA